MNNIKMISPIKTDKPITSIILFGVISVFWLVMMFLFMVNPVYFIAGIFIFVFLFLVAWTIKTKREFQIIFLLLFIIGFFQGFIDKVNVIFPFLPSNSIWGPAKYFLMFLLVVKYISKIIIEKRLTLNRGMRWWLGAWILNVMVFSLLFWEAKIAEPRYNGIGAIQNFGIGNMLLCFMVYFDSNQRQVNTALKIFVWFGVFAALFGILQRLVGPEYFAALGFDLYDPYMFSFLSSTNLETRFLDLEKGFRAFSFFASHHAFSGFLILSTLSLQVLHLQKKISSFLYFISMIILMSGFIVTFNLTNILSCILILMLLAYFQHAKKLKGLIKVFLKKSVLRNIVIIIIIAICAVSFIEPLRDRLAGMFEVSELNVGAGGSLYNRIAFISNGLSALAEHPFGLGLLLRQISDPKSELSGYARENYFAENDLEFSGDSWFLYLLVQLGLPFGILYFLMFAIPLYFGWKLKDSIIDGNLRVLFHGVLALILITILGGISNSPILVFPPSNLFIWAAVGLLIVIPTWDREFSDKITMDTLNENRV